MDSRRFCRQITSGAHTTRRFFDQGVFATSAISKHAAELCDITLTCFFEQDSRQVLGLQVADLVAHTSSLMLLAELDLARKTVKARDNSGYEPNLDVELAFELWASVRYSFFAAGPPPPDEWESQLDFQVDVESRGLHVAAACAGSEERCLSQIWPNVSWLYPLTRFVMTLSDSLDSWTRLLDHILLSLLGRR